MANLSALSACSSPSLSAVCQLRGTITGSGALSSGSAAAVQWKIGHYSSPSRFTIPSLATLSIVNNYTLADGFTLSVGVGFSVAVTVTVQGTLNLSVPAYGR
jgi:hypothetical protein